MANQQISGLVALSMVSLVSLSINCGGDDGTSDVSPTSTSDTGDGGSTDIGDGGSGSGGNTGGGDEDVSAPSIVSIVPDDGDAGVVIDTDIVITFNEPMNKAATQSAYQSADIIAADSVMTWNSEGTELTIDPNADLEYAVGSDPATVDAYEYSFLVSTLAEDLAGNALAEQADVTFATLRSIENQPFLASDHALSGHWRSDNSAGSCSGAMYCVGDSGSAANAHYLLGLTFDLSALAAGADLLAAEISASQETVIGAPYTDLGTLNLEHVSYSVLDSVSPGSLFLVSPLSNGNPVGPFSSTAVLEEKVMDVQTQVADDILADSGLTQFRLRWTTTSDFDNQGDGPMFTRASMALFLSYLAP